MRILHIIPTYLPAYQRGGPIWSVHNLNKWLVKKGIDVTVYTTDIDVPRDIPRGVAVNRDGARVFYFPASFPRAWEYSRAMHRALSKNMGNFDLVHITSTFLAVSTLGAYYAKKFKKPYVISPRGNLMREPLAMKSPLKKKLYLALIEKRNLAGAAAIHFTTESEKEEYHVTGLPLREAIMIPNGLDPDELQSYYGAQSHKIDFRKKFGIGKNKKVVLFLGRLNWKKGFDTLIPAFARIAKEEPDAVLVIVGRDEDGYKKTIDVLIAKHNVLRGRVIFTDMLLGDDKIAAFHESQAFVLSSYSENFAMSVIEAMYFKLPVVITKNVGIAPSVARAGAGLVINKDEKELAEAILRILHNQKLAGEISVKGTQLVRKEFLMPRIIERWVSAYQDLI